MKIVFFGSSEFAVESLKKIAETKNELSCVVTQPDRKKGRHLLSGSTAVKDTAVGFGLKLIQPAKIDSSFIESIKKMQADIFVVVSYGLILPKSLISVPKKMAINVHASLLPKYRGAAPINWAIIKGEKKTGVTIIKMNEFMDQGEIIAQKEIEIKTSDTSETLNKKLSVLGAETLDDVLVKLEQGEAELKKQNSKEATLAPKLKRTDGLIDWSKPAEDIFNKTRGTIPWPGSFSYWQGKLLKIWQVKVVSLDVASLKPGEVISASKEGILVACGDNAISIKLLQLESGRKLTADQFICGHKITKGIILT